LTVQVAEYNVFDVGLTVMLLPVCPVDQVTIPVQLVAVSVAFWPELMVFGEAIKLGVAGTSQITATAMRASPLLQPFTLQNA